MAETSERLRYESPKGGGPKSISGKRKSSQNALKHGCRSAKKLLKGESRKAYNALWKRWTDEYLPITEVELELVELLVDCAWRLKRAERALRAAEAEHQVAEGGEARAEARAQVAVQQRYRTTAENSFFKTMRVLEARKSEEKRAAREWGRDAAREFAQHLRLKAKHPEVAERHEKIAQKRMKATEKTPAETLFRGQTYERAANAARALAQTVRVEQVDGVTVTTFVPTNEELIAEGQALLPPPIGVARQFTFVNGLIPYEYAWAGMPTGEEMAALPADGDLTGEQCMTMDQWLTVIAEEKERGDGHAGPTGVGNFNPTRAGQEDRCECPACEVAREVAYFSKLKQLAPPSLNYSLWANPTRWDVGRRFMDEYVSGGS